MYNSKTGPVSAILDQLKTIVLNIEVIPLEQYPSFWQGWNSTQWIPLAFESEHDLSHENITHQ